MEPEPPDLPNPARPWQHNLIGVALYVLVIFFAWRLLDLNDQDVGLDKAMLSILGALVVPFLAMMLSASHPEFYCIGPTAAGSSQLQVGPVVLIPAYPLFLTLMGQFELVSWPVLILVAASGGLILACMMSRLRFELFAFVCIMGFSGAYFSCALLFFNCMIDHNPVEVVAQRHADDRASPRAFTVKLKHARPHGRSQLHLNAFNFSDTKDGICVRVFRGALFLGWYTVAPYYDCPGADPRLDDVMHSKAQLCSAGHQHACQTQAKFKAGKYSTDELAMDWAEMACVKGSMEQCALLCKRGKRILGCASEALRTSGRDWYVHGWTEDVGPDGRYLANLRVSCTVPLSTSAQPTSKPVQHAIEHDGEQFRGPVSRRMHKTLGEAMAEVCAAAPALAPTRKAPNYSLPPLEAHGTPAATTVHKCQGADGKITLSDSVCPQ